MPLGTGLGYLSASHNSSPIVNNGNSMHSVVPGTTLGGGKTYSQIWGAPNLSSPHMAGLSTLSEGSPSQATWTSSTPTKSQLLVSFPILPNSLSISTAKYFPTFTSSIVYTTSSTLQSITGSCWLSKLSSIWSNLPDHKNAFNYGYVRHFSIK